MGKRKNIPVAIKRALLEETIYRCASCLVSIEHCEDDGSFFQFDEKAHIVPHSETQDDSFNNLITLCPICHRKYDKMKNKKESTNRLRKLKMHWLNISGKYTKVEIDTMIDLYQKKPYPWTKEFVIPDDEYKKKIKEGLQKRREKQNSKDLDIIQNMPFYQYGLEYIPENLINKLISINLENVGVIEVLSEINLSSTDVLEMRNKNKYFVVSVPDKRNLIFFRNIIESKLVLLDSFTGELVMYLSEVGKSFCEKLLNI